MSATTRKGRRVAAARYPYQARAVRGPGSDGPRGLAVNGLLPLIKLLSLLWFHYLVIFNYILNTNLFTVGTVLLPACTGTAVPPAFGSNRPKIAVKATATPLRGPVSIAVGVKTPRQLAPFDHAPTTARAQDDEIARRALAVRCGRGRRAHSRQAQLRRPLSCVYKK